MLTRVAVFAAVLLLLAFGFAQFVRRTTMFFPSRDGDWHIAGDLWFTAADGVRLHGWLFRASEPHAPLLVWCHGNAGNITDRAPIAAALARRGASVFLFDWRGYGKSDGDPSEAALYRDA